MNDCKQVLHISEIKNKTYVTSFFCDFRNQLFYLPFNWGIIEWESHFWYACHPILALCIGKLVWWTFEDYINPKIRKQSIESRRGDKYQVQTLNFLWAYKQHFDIQCCHFLNVWFVGDKYIGMQTSNMSKCSTIVGII